MKAHVLTLVMLFSGLGCSSGGGNTQSQGGSANGNGGAASGGSSTSAGRPSVGTGGELHSGPQFAGAECPDDVGFPDAYALNNLKAQIDGANVRISFDPQADAADYRVYALPKSGDITADGVKGATFRCGGGGSVPSPPNDDEKRDPTPGVTTVVNANVEGYMRKTEDATLGYVFTTPADDRIPVYAMGDPNIRADNTDCYEMRWPQSRKKRYVTSDSEREKLLAERWRDDGIVFYVPKASGDDTKVVYQHVVTSGDWGAYLYIADDAERSARKMKGATETEAFPVYASLKDGAEPLMRVYYGLTCGHGHDELAAGRARFAQAFKQGALPVTELHWAGLTEETTLVVEALDQACPYQGVFSPTPRPARVDPFPMSNDISYPAFETPDQLRAKSPIGELYINGQGDGTKPRAISRACVKVKPEPAPTMDFFFQGEETFGAGTYRNFQSYDVDSPTFATDFIAVATDQWSIGTFAGELWTTYSDWAADTNGKVRITPKQRATLADESFVHASMEVDIVSTARRYPQLWVSNAEAPVQANMKDKQTVVVQTIGGITYPVTVDLQFCDQQEWDVNNQCTYFDIQKLKGADGNTFLSPRPEVTGWMGVDRTVRFDVYVSTSRVYLYANRQPYGCANLPAGRLTAGPATITFGDVLYHSGVDLEKWYPFHVEKMHILTTRHFSNLGFSSGVSAPVWDESRIPCATELKK